MEIETPGSFEITKLLIIDVWHISIHYRLGQAHGFRRLVGNARTIKIDRVIEFILKGDNNNRIARHCFIDCDINTEEKSDDNGDDQYDGNDRVFLPHSLRSQYSRRVIL